MLNYKAPKCSSLVLPAAEKVGLCEELNECETDFEGVRAAEKDRGERSHM